MLNIVTSIRSGKMFRGLSNLVMILAAGIPVFIITSYYASEIAEHHAKDIALLVSIYFGICVYTGRYASRLLIRENEPIPRSLFMTLGAILVISIILLFFLAEFTKHFSMNFLRILFIGFPFTVFSLTLGMLIKLIRTSIKNQLVEAKAVAEQSQSELRFLQSQLSPHFLFNTLNNIYGLSLTQHEKIPGLLLKLSDLLRYSVYDAKELYVPLKNEVAYIKDYIDFEKIRIGDKLEISAFFEEPVNPSLKIAPLLLIVFIENAFKHAKNTTEQKIYINITLKTWERSILFSIRNSTQSSHLENTILKENSGFGLENVRKRLELLYPDKYDLKIETENGYYMVLLQLKTK